MSVNYPENAEDLYSSSKYNIDSDVDLWINVIQSFVALWESTACAAYLMNHPKYPVEERLLYVETSSYDTISNAFFARSTMTDVAGWRKLLIVTNEVR